MTSKYIFEIAEKLNKENKELVLDERMFRNKQLTDTLMISTSIKNYLPEKQKDFVLKNPVECQLTSQETIWTFSKERQIYIERPQAIFDKGKSNGLLPGMVLYKNDNGYVPQCDMTIEMVSESTARANLQSWKNGKKKCLSGTYSTNKNPQAADETPTYSNHILNANFSLNEKKYVKALERYENAFLEYQKNGMDYYHAALAACQLGDIKKANQYLNHAIENHWLDEKSLLEEALLSPIRDSKYWKALPTKMQTNKVEFLKGNNENFILVDDESFHSGLSGLVAGSLKDKYNKPAIVVTYVENENGVMEGRGSGRSVKGVNMADIFIAARNENILLKGGGHAMAGGFTVMPERLDDFKKFIGEYISEHKDTVEELPSMHVDGIATVRGAKPEFVKLLNHNVGPFGMGNAEPVFALSDLRLFQVDVLKEKHIRVMLTDAEGGTRMKAMFFSGVGTPLGDMMLNNSNNTHFHLIGQFQINNWQGRESVEFHIIDGVDALSSEMRTKQAV